jgi:Peptidase family M28
VVAVNRSNMHRACDRQLDHRFRPLITSIIALVIAACGRERAPEPAHAGAVPADPSADSATATIVAEDMARRIGFLAQDRLRGRVTPSEELNEAAAFIASEFQRLGLEPGGDDGTWLQWYPVSGGSRAPNVVGILRGSDPALRDTYVVYSAHMDHVGVGLPDATGDSIYNGADDDASGTAAVMAIAEAFASLPRPPLRSVVFLTVSGEEEGLWGSTAFVRSGPFPVASLVADLNLDMISRNEPDRVVVIGLRYSDLGDRVEGVAATHPELGLSVIDDPWPDERFFFRSDHYNFARAGVPALFFFAGVHEDYHRPSDEADRIDAGKAARVARLAFRTGLGVAESRNPPAWTRAGLSEVQPEKRSTPEPK